MIAIGGTYKILSSILPPPTRREEPPPPRIEEPPPTRINSIQQHSTDCRVKWDPWSDCTTRCGNGTKNRKGHITTPATNGGVCLSEDQLLQTMVCNLGDCPPPEDCYIAWTPWGSCISPGNCGAGKSTRMGKILQPGMYGGKACPTDLTQTQVCDSVPCDLDCVFEWGPWSECDPSDCGTNGTQIQYAIIKTHATDGGKPCPDKMYNLRTCVNPDCQIHQSPVDCIVDWQITKDCDKACGGGTVEMTGTITQQAIYGGKTCPTNLNMTQVCNTDPCPPQDCVVQWGNWSDCSAVCGGGIQTKTGIVISPTSFGGKACPANLTQVQTCNTDIVCPEDCIMEWSPWSDCTTVCGPGIQTRIQSVKQPAIYGGKACPPQDQRIQTMTCNPGPCPVNCSITWSSWSDCDKHCGGGVQTRTSTVTQNASVGGVQCPPLGIETQTCNTEPCPIDCNIQWSTWTDCSTGCGGGTQTRTATILNQAEYGGLACPTELQDIQQCNTEACQPIDCLLDWSQWSPCSIPCGGGLQTQNATIIQQPAYGGSMCPDNLTRTQTCNTNVCPPIDCIVDYGDWSVCSSTCGPGTQTKNGTIIQQAYRGGAACPALTITQNCNPGPCPQDCIVDWSSWSSCSQACGGGTQYQTGTIIKQASSGGASCPSTLVKYQNCNTIACQPLAQPLALAPAIWHAQGCYADSTLPVVPNLVQKTTTYSVANCQSAVAKAGYNTMGLQKNNGSFMCYGGTNSPYNQYGSSTNCYPNGTGVYANTIFSLTY